MIPIRMSLVQPSARRAAVLGWLLLFALPANADDSRGQVTRRLADPLASLDQLFLYFDWDTQMGGFDEGKRQALGIEPAFSFELDGGSRLVSRTLVPVIHLDGGTADGSVTGLGDLLQTIYYVPSARHSGFHWGVGASLRVPSASDDSLGRDGASVGPAAAATWIGDRWTWGAQLQHQAALDSDVDDVTLVQPFMAREFDGGWSSGVQVDATYEWERDRLKGPLTLYARKQFSSDHGNAYAFDAGFRYWVDGPTEEPEWGVRVGVFWVF